MLDGYFLRGVNNEYILVVKSDSPDCLHSLIKRIAAMRQREFKDLGAKLEEDFEFD